MSERADPEDPNFKGGWELKFRKKVIPVLKYRKNPYREAVISRYRWVAQDVAGKTVLDVPCGVGWGTSYLKAAKDLQGCDIDEGAIQKASSSYSSIGSFKVGGMDNLPYENNHFDVVCCLEGIEHVPEDVGNLFFEEATRVLKSNGLLFLSSPYVESGEHSGNPYHVKEYRTEEIEEKFAPFFDVDSKFSKRVDIMTIDYFKLRVRG